MVAVFDTPNNGHTSTEGDGGTGAPEIQPSELHSYMLDEIRRQRADLQERRDDPELRQIMVGLIEQIGELVHERAIVLAAATQGSVSPFVIDESADSLVWQLAEYFSQGFLEPNTSHEPPILRGGQVDGSHAAAWFNCHIAGGEVVPLPVEVQR